MILHYLRLAYNLEEFVEVVKWAVSVDEAESECGEGVLRRRGLGKFCFEVISVSRFKNGWEGSR